MSHLVLILPIASDSPNWPCVMCFSVTVAVILATTMLSGNKHPIYHIVYTCMNVYSKTLCIDTLNEPFPIISIQTYVIDGVSAHRPQSRQHSLWQLSD